jgi:hypothetical protein
MVFSMAQIDIAFEINYARVQYLALFRVYALSNIELTGTLLYKQELNSSVTSCDKARRGGKIH